MLRDPGDQWVDTHVQISSTVLSYFQEIYQTSRCLPRFLPEGETNWPYPSWNASPSLSGHQNQDLLQHLNPKEVQQAMFHIEDAN